MLLWRLNEKICVWQWPKPRLAWDFMCLSNSTSSAHLKSFFAFYIVILLEQSKNVPGLITTCFLHRISQTAEKEHKTCPLLQFGFGHMEMQIIYSWGEGGRDRLHLMWIMSVTRGGLQPKMSVDHSPFSGTTYLSHWWLLIANIWQLSASVFSLVIGMCLACVWDRQQMTGI